MVETGQETTWLEQSRQGDHAAFENLIRCHQRMIYSLAYRMTGSAANAEDLAQETFLRAYKQLGTFQQQSKFSSWLYQIAMNLSLDWRKRESRRDGVHSKWAADAIVENDSRDRFPDELSRQVQAALNRLPAKQRAAIVLTVHEDHSHAEAAKLLRCSEATISWRVFAARQKLKRWLKPHLKSHEQT